MKLRLLISFFGMMLLSICNAQVTTVGIIGTATPNGWDSDTDMVQDPDSSNLWTLSIELTDGEAKFRANDAWDINWGDTDFPIGVGTQGGPNIPVIAGFYDITFNSNTGAYYFELSSDIGIIGSATPFGWNADVSMNQSTTDTNEYYITLELIAGEAKFRANDAWDINWGSTDFPSGIGVQNGPNIPIPAAGTYYITFNKATGAYNFEALLIISSVGIIGDATPGGWGATTPMTQNPNDGNIWTLSAPLTTGGVQFSINDGQILWGSSDFPTGVAVEGGDTIPATEGNWLIEINTATGEYSFNIIEIFETVGIIGDATPGGWAEDTDMERSPTDSSQWSLRIILTDGEAKFRANDAWDVNWGSGDFPTGIATRDGANIPITAGEYLVTFNSITGAYNFKEIIVYDRIGLVGSGTPTMSWDVDFFLTQDPNDENIWYMNSIDLDGEVKFRADSNWTVNWGATGFPTDIGTQDGPNIPVPAGTYGIVFNSATGLYVFQDPLSTKDVLNPSSISVFPNPASDMLHVDMSATAIRGEVNLNVFDMNGKLVLSDKQHADEQINLRVAGLQNGYYTLHISNDKYIIGQKFVILK
jgi:starch-binding outer membrane protein SusE/F